MFGHSFTNAALLEVVGQKVYGHMEAKKSLISMFNRAMIRWHQEFNLRQSENLVPLRNTLLIGDSGTGKTFLVETIAELCGFNLIVIDATQIVPSGASGKTNIEYIINKIKKKAEAESKLLNGVYTAEECMRKIIVFIDEIDKLGRSFDVSGSWNKHVQSNILQLVEEKAGIRGVTFVFAGAFQGMIKEEKTSSIGFTPCAEENKNEVDWSNKVIEAGLIPELVGRISCVVKLDDLELKDYTKILTEYIIPLHQKTLTYYGINRFRINKKKQAQIIDKAMKSKQGVRLLKREVEKISNEIEFDFEENYFNGGLLK